MIAALLENIARREILILLVWPTKEDSVTSNSLMYAEQIFWHIWPSFLAYLWNCNTSTCLMVKLSTHASC